MNARTPIPALCGMDTLLDAITAPKRHWSSCAVHNEPAYPAGPCDCGGYDEDTPEPHTAPVMDDYDETSACCCCGDRFNTGFLGSNLSMFDFGIRDNCGDLVCEACVDEYVEAQLTDREPPYAGSVGVWL